MPLNRLGQLLKPQGPAQYDPNREAMFAQLLAQGSAPAQNLGSAIGNIARLISGTIGSRRQGQARQKLVEDQQRMEMEQQARQSQALADALSGAGINVSPEIAGVVAGNKGLTQLLAPKPDPQAKPTIYNKPIELENQAGERKIVTSRQELLDAQGEGFGMPRPAEKQEQARIVKGADGYNYYASGPQAGQRVLPGVQRQEKAPLVKVNTGEPALTFGDVSKFRQEFTTQSKGFKAVQDSYRKVESLAKRGSAVSDHALIFAYFKTVDPDSVVRESEFEIASNLGSIPQRLRAAAMKVANGQRLTPEQRKDFVETSKQTYMAAVDQQNQLREQYKNIGEGYGIKQSDLLQFVDPKLTGGASQYDNLSKEQLQQLAQRGNLTLQQIEELEKVWERKGY